MATQYEHATYISTLISGREAITFSQELLTRIREMFAQIQQPWEETRPPGRSNFLNYKHCIYKMLELLGEDEYTKLLTLLKAPHKRYEQDQMWKAICNKLSWEFISTV